MSDTDKTKAQLLDEIKVLRKHVAKIERSKPDLRKSEQELRMMGHAVTSSIRDKKEAEKQILTANERLKFLLSSTSVVFYTAKAGGDYGAIFISENVTQLTGFKARSFIKNPSFWLDHIHPNDVQRVLEGVANVFDKDIHKDEYRFRKKDGSYICVSDEQRLVRDQKGRPVEIVGYWLDISKNKEAEEELKRAYELMEQRVEERTAELREANIQMRQEIDERIRFEKALEEREKELEKQTVALEQKNIALREIIAQIEVEKRRIQDDVMANVHVTITPILEKLRLENIAPRQVALLYHHINDLTSSFSSGITNKSMKLTTKEIEICNMVKAGLSNKDISRLQNISPKTVEGHRKKIRQKLGLTGKKINLTSYLQRI